MASYFQVPHVPQCLIWFLSSNLVSLSLSCVPSTSYLPPPKLQFKKSRSASVQHWWLREGCLHLSTADSATWPGRMLPYPTVSYASSTWSFPSPLGKMLQLSPMTCSIISDKMLSKQETELKFYLPKKCWWSYFIPKGKHFTKLVL